MRIPEPRFSRILKTKLKDRFYHRPIYVQYAGKREKIRLLSMFEIFQLQKYKFDSRKKDVLSELSDYYNEPPEIIEKRMHEADVKTDKKYLYENPKDDESVRRFYSTTSSYLLQLMRASYEFRHISKRTNIALSVSLYFNKKNMMDFGAGSGRDCLTFAKKGFKVTHVDCKGCFTDFAQWRYFKRGLNIKIVDPKDLSADNQTHDSIICFDVLQLVVDPMRWVKIFIDKLNPKGLLFIFGDFDNLSTPLHLSENTKFGYRLDQELSNLGLEKIADLGIQVWMKMPGKVNSSGTSLNSGGQWFLKEAGL